MKATKPSCLLTLLTSITLVAATACAPEAPDKKPVPQSRQQEPAAEAEPIRPGHSRILQSYDGTAYQYPIRAQYPDSMQVDGGCIGEGCGFSFTFAPRGNALDDAEVHVFLPAAAHSADDLEPSVTGPNGLIARAGWTVNDIESGRSEAFPYDWVQTVISFSGDRGQSGHILLGETSGQAVQVLLKYPAEMAEAYWRDAEIVLESLEFEEELLPLTSSSS
ncbi:hypothetical protein [Thioalkalivibrio sp.]|uniref:hypothetical protein n=1 Tax=Thioalkalivibrio sp. TaxID=2093813 RepID=UPI003564DE25